MTRKTRALLSNVLFGLVIAGGVALLLYRTDRARLVAEPYAAITIVPESVSQHRIDGSPEWGLFYSIKTTKRVHCTEVVVERFVHRIDDPFPLASNRDVSGETIPVSSDDRLTAGLHARLTQPLGPGNYFLLIRHTCYVKNGDGPNLPLAPSAEAFVCFSVPDAMPPPDGDQRLQPISKNCRRDLSQVMVQPIQRRLAGGR